MTTITELLGGGQVLQGLNYDVQTLFEERLNEGQRLFPALLRLVEDEGALVKVRKRRGRKPYDLGPHLRAENRIERGVVLAPLRNFLGNAHSRGTAAQKATGASAQGRDSSGKEDEAIGEADFAEALQSLVRIGQGLFMGKQAQQPVERV